MNANRKDPDGTVRVLQVEDSSADAEMVSDGLHKAGLDCAINLVDSETAYLRALDEFAPDIVLSDLSLPGFDGYHALQLLRERDKLLPFIFVSGTMGEDVAVEALHQGATDYVLKGSPARLAPAVRRALRDAAERRRFDRLEAELLRAQRFESLALLAGGLSHDLRNLLQPLLLAADTLDDYQADPRLARLGGLIRGCGTRGLEMVSSMLTFARGARKSEQVRVRALFDAVSLLLQGSVPAGINLHIVPSSVPNLQFEGNHTELQQCLLNLCLNAIQAMPEGGTLRVSAEPVVLDADFFAPTESAKSGKYLELCVSDTGVGMSTDVMGHLFQPFFTTKASGTGLGLMSCKRIVEGNNGVLRVHSTAGEGSRFCLFLPLDAASDDVDVGPLPVGKGEHVLVVAENAAKLLLLADTLDSYGYAVRREQSGTAALQSLQRSGLPQLVIIDADMSLLTGVRTLAALIDHDYAGGVLLLTRPDAPPDLDGLPPLPHLHLLDKPVQTDRLLRSVRACLDACAM